QKGHRSIADQFLQKLHCFLATRVERLPDQALLLQFRGVDGSTEADFGSVFKAKSISVDHLHLADDPRVHSLLRRKSDAGLDCILGRTLVGGLDSRLVGRLRGLGRGLRLSVGLATAQRRKSDRYQHNVRVRFHNWLIESRSYMRPNARTERRERPGAFALRTDDARPRSLR